MAGLKDTIATLARLRNQPVMGFPGVDTGLLTRVNAFGDNPGALAMHTYAPAGLARGRPLIVVLHGCTQTAESYAVEAGWVALADRFGLGLLCPEQVAQNNANRCFNWFNPADVQRGGGEAASIRGMIDKAVSLMGSDRSKVYVTGLSAGGAMAAAMLATYPEIFAGGGIIAGLPYGVAHDMPTAFAAMQQGSSLSGAELGRRVRAASGHTGVWPRIAIWHGTADATVKAANADASSDQWLAVNGLAAQPDDVTVDGADRRERWVKDGAVVVERRLISGLGHATPIAQAGPDGAGRPGAFVFDIGLSSSLELLRFWGVVPEGERAHVSAKPAAPQRRRDEDLPIALRRPLGEQGISAVINDALRSAGLMK